MGEAFASVSAGALKVSAAACGDAVSNAVSGLCAGSDPMATIFGVTQACASALADVYTRAVTNATVLPIEDPTGLREQEEEGEEGGEGDGDEQEEAGSGARYPSSALWWPALKGPGAASSPGGPKGVQTALDEEDQSEEQRGQQGQRQTTQTKQRQRRGYLTACASGCANAQASAEAFAQAAACGVAKGTDQCAAAMAQVKTRAFSSAFVKTAASAWSSACARGYGRAGGGGEQVAQAAAAAIAKVTAQLAATACSTCAGCKCKPLPKGFDWSDPSDYASASASLADGRTVVAKAAASATVAYCATPDDLKPKALNASVDGVLDALAEVLTTASGNLSATSEAVGGVGNAWACGGVSLEARLGAAKDAYGAAVEDAAALVFGGWCPRAAARMTRLAAVNQDLTETLVSESLESCAGGGPDGGFGDGEGGGGGQKNKTIRSVVGGHKPWVDAAHDALTDAEACGCRPRPLCTTCTGAADRLAKVAERMGKDRAADALKGIVLDDEEEEGEEAAAPGAAAPVAASAARQAGAAAAAAAARQAGLDVTALAARAAREAEGGAAV